MYAIRLSQIGLENRWQDQTETTLSYWLPAILQHSDVIGRQEYGYARLEGRVIICGIQSE